jgi:transcription initiation factor TFIIIB Brf1 subunit/transcription initiation factor TFIIB
VLELSAQQAALYDSYYEMYAEVCGLKKSQGKQLFAYFEIFERLQGEQLSERIEKCKSEQLANLKLSGLGEKASQLQSEMESLNDRVERHKEKIYRNLLENGLRADRILSIAKW